MSIIIERVYLDEAALRPVYPQFVQPEVLSDPRHILSFAFDDRTNRHTLHIVYQNIETVPVRVMTAVLTESDDKVSVHRPGWTKWTKPGNHCMIGIELPAGVHRIVKIQFQVDKGASSALQDSSELCAVLERLEKNSGCNTQYILIAKPDDGEPYMVHSPMGPLDVLTALNQVQAGVIQDTARLIGEL